MNKERIIEIKRRIIKLVFTVSCVFMLIGCTSANQENVKDSEIKEEETINEDIALSELTLHVWSDTDQENKVYSDTSSEDVQLYTDLFDILSSSKENSDDIIVMGAMLLRPFRMA